MKRILYCLALLVCILLGFYLRTMNKEIVFQQDTTNLYGSDSSYHMRRILRTMADYPHMKNFDPFMAYPYGATCVWPPLFDFSIASTARFLKYDESDRLLVERLASYFPVFAGVLTIIAVYFLGLELFGPTTGILAAFLFSIMPGHVQTTMLGHVDHHSIEPFFTVLILIFSVRMLQSEKPLRNGIMLGIFIALALLSWRGSIMVSGLLGLYLFIVTIFTSDPLYRERLVTANLVTFLTALILITPYCLSTPWSKNREMTFIALSLFHILFFLSFVLLFGFQRIILLQRGYLLDRPVFFVYSVALPLIASILIAVVTPEYVRNLFSGLEYIGKVDPWLRSISEFQPLFWNQGFWDAKHPEQMLSYSVYLMPFILAWLTYRVSSYGKSFSPHGELFLLWSIIIGIVTLLQRRYVHQFAVVNSIYLGFTISALYDSYTVKASMMKKFFIFVLIAVLLYPVFSFYVDLDYTARKLALVTVVNLAIALIVTELVAGWFQLVMIWRILLMVILCFALIPVTGRLPAPWHYPTFETQYSGLPASLRDLLLWMKNNTPDPGSISPGEHVHAGMPGYGIMAPWSYGHWITYLANRPAIANNFGYAQHGLKASMKFYLSEDPDEVVEMMQNLNVRYVIIEFTLPDIQDYVNTLGLKKKYISSDDRTRDKDGNLQRNIFPENSYYQIIATQLFFLNRHQGKSKQSGQTVSLDIGNHRFTLVYESDDGQFRLFEFQ